MRAPTDAGKLVDKHGNQIQLDLLQPSCIHDLVKHILVDREVCSLSLYSYGYISLFLSIQTSSLHDWISCFGADGRYGMASRRSQVDLSSFLKLEWPP